MPRQLVIFEMSRDAAPALVLDDDVRALVLLQKLGNQTYVWSIDCADASSGTALLRAMCHVSHDMALGYTVQSRWWVAKSFFLSGE